MGKFQIIKDDPLLYRAEILQFWEELLPGTPAARLEWMQENPAGSACWFFAIEKQSGRLAGTISLFPKDLFFEGHRVRAAILGDFMLDKKFRVFGPALALLKAAISTMDDGQFDFLFTLPNVQSQKIVARAGLSPSGRVYSMMSPQSCDFIVKKIVGSVLAGIVNRPMSWGLHLCSRATYAGQSGLVEEFDWQNNAFDVFCQRLQEQRKSLMTGYYSQEYLDWRYRRNPEPGYKIYVFRNHAGGAVKGFFVCLFAQNRLKLYDIAALEKKIMYKMIKKLNSLCRENKCRGIYLSIYESNPLLPVLKQCCFFDTRDQVEIYTYPADVAGLDRWAFTSSDRNV